MGSRKFMVRLAGVWLAAWLVRFAVDGVVAWVPGVAPEPATYPDGEWRVG